MKIISDAEERETDESVRDTTMGSVCADRTSGKCTLSIHSREKAGR